MLDRALDRVARTLLVLAAVLGFALGFLVVADVIGRVAFLRPVKGTKELVETSIVIICYLQAAYAIRSGSMLNTDFATSLLPRRLRLAFYAAGAVLGSAFFALVCWGSFEPAAHAWNSGEYEGEGALRVPVWPARFVLILGSFLAALAYLMLALKLGRQALGAATADGAAPAPRVH
jgi:TRAP-type C4-dicarboxylate transport system permease small subunit